MTRGIPIVNSLFKEVHFRLLDAAVIHGQKLMQQKHHVTVMQRLPSQFRIQTSSELHMHCIFNSKECENTVNR